MTPRANASTVIRFPSTENARFRGEETNQIIREEKAGNWGQQGI
jgi:hypothetical protein